LRITVAAVGRQRPGPLKALQDLYADRITWPLTLHEVEERRHTLRPSELKEREAQLLRAKIPEGAFLITLDQRGVTLESEGFARRLEAWRLRGVPDLAFVIGGAEGVAESLRAGSNLVLSLGTMTWPHLLARTMLLEQLYRAQQILAGHPYHRR